MFRLTGRSTKRTTGRLTKRVTGRLTRRGTGIFAKKDLETPSSDDDDDDDGDDDDTDDGSLEYSTDKSVIEDEMETDEDVDLDTDTKSEDDLRPEELDYVRRRTLISEEDFFKILENIPSLSDFKEESEDMETELKEEEMEEQETQIDYEEGTFVDPLTGEVRKRIIKPKEYEKTEVEEKSETEPERMIEPEIVPKIVPKIEEEITSKRESDDLWYEKLDALYGSEEEATEIALKKEEDETNIEALFIDKEEEPVVMMAKFDFDAWQKLEEERIIEESMIELMADVIKAAIETSERNNAINELYNNLNKNKLITELAKLKNEQEHENWLKIQLNRKCVEYYCRKKAYRTITEESAKVADYNKKKLHEEMERLDCLLASEHAVKIKTENTIKELRKQLEDLEKINQNEVENFENMILNNIIRGDRNNLRNNIRKPLNIMARERKNISLLHSKIIAKQQIALTRKKKIADAENLGNGLRISDYRKRDADLEKLRNLLCKDIGQMTHMRKKRHILVEQVTTQREALRDLGERRELLRKQLDRLTHIRLSLRHQIRNVTHQSGLLSKPLLIVDYQEATKRVEDLNEIIANLRTKYGLLQERFKNYKNC
uniref:DUF4201 domain-containing protein n=1 Tax=Glossina brevipalpis TaxID=37001 RepID=A0A1A9X4U8_9MUSC